MRYTYSLHVKEQNKNDGIDSCASQQPWQLLFQRVRSCYSGGHRGDGKDWILVRGLTNLNIESHVPDFSGYTYHDDRCNGDQTSDQWTEEVLDPLQMITDSLSLADERP